MMKNFPAQILALLLLAGLLAACSEDKMSDDGGEENLELTHEFSTRVIYGEDDRKDLYEISDNRLLHLAKSTAVLMDSYNLKADGNHYNIDSRPFGDQFNLCSTERFAEQESAGFCSGFLVGPKTFVTAGHCIRRTADCNNVRFVFDYAITKKNSSSPKRIHKDKVYKCTKLIKSFVESRGADYAVLELDREVVDRTPLSFRTEGQIDDKAGLVVIGHPSGIPTKVAAGANVRSQANGFFVANLDTYGGNSGSAVFNSKTGVVEGILVRGERDFIYKGNCKVSNECTDEGCRGEDVTRITEAAPYIKTNKTHNELTQILYNELGFSSHH